MKTRTLLNILLIVSFTFVSKKIFSYGLGDQGPAGGFIFLTPGSEGNNTNLYFEVAPKKIGNQGVVVVEEGEAKVKEVEKVWQKSPIRGSIYAGNNLSLFLESKKVGSGKINTEEIVEKTKEFSTETAAGYCYALTLGGKDDWFLASIDELEFIYINLYKQNLGNFENGYYWSSSEEDEFTAWTYLFGAAFFNKLTASGKSYIKNNVRCVRSFKAN